MSESFARGGGGKNAFCSTFPFCSFVVALFSSVGTNVEVGMLSMYFLICHIVLPSALPIHEFFPCHLLGSCYFEGVFVCDYSPCSLVYVMFRSSIHVSQSIGLSS